MERPLNKQLVDNICIANGLRNAKELGAASIRQFVSVVKDIEDKTGVEYIRMEIGEPGLPAEQIGIDAEHEALLSGVGSRYPLITGIEPLTKEASRFIKAFVNRYPFALHCPHRRLYAGCIWPVYAYQTTPPGAKHRSISRPRFSCAEVAVQGARFALYCIRCC